MLNANEQESKQGSRSSSKHDWTVKCYNGSLIASRCVKEVDTNKQGTRVKAREQLRRSGVSLVIRFVLDTKLVIAQVTVAKGEPSAEPFGEALQTYTFKFAVPIF